MFSIFIDIYANKKTIVLVKITGAQFLIPSLIGLKQWNENEKHFHLSVQKFQNLVPINCHLPIFMLSYQLIWGNSRGGGETNVTNACSLLNSNERTGWGVILIKNVLWEQSWIGTWLTIKICAGNINTVILKFQTPLVLT